MPTTSSKVPPGDPTPPPDRTVAWGVSALVVALVLICYALLWRNWDSFVRAIDQTRWLFNDFRFHFFPMAAGILEATEPVEGYFYSAFFALLLRPLAWLSIDSASGLWGGIQAVTFAALCLLPLARLLRLPNKSLPFYTLLCMTSYPALSNFKWGQVSVILTLLAMAALDASSRKRSVLAGLLVAVAASIKYYSGAFLFLFLLRKDWKACLAFGAGGLICFVLLPAAFMGPADWFSFHKAGLEALANSEWIAGDANSQYFAHVLQRWMNGFSGTPGTAPRFLEAAGLFVAVLNLGMACRLRGDTRPESFARSLGLLFTAFPYLIATSWPHYFVYLPFCQALTLQGLTGLPLRFRPLKLASFALVSCSILFASVPFFLIFPSWLAYQEKGFLLIANTLLLPPLYLLCVSDSVKRAGETPPACAP